MAIRQGDRDRSRRDLQHVWPDLTGLTFIDASGLSALVQVRMLVDGRGGRLILHGSRPFVRRLLTITNPSRDFTFEPSLASPQDR